MTFSTEQRAHRSRERQDQYLLIEALNEDFWEADAPETMYIPQDPDEDTVLIGKLVWSDVLGDVGWSWDRMYTLTEARELLG